MGTKKGDGDDKDPQDDPNAAGKEPHQVKEWREQQENPDSRGDCAALPDSAGSVITGIPATLRRGSMTAADIVRSAAAAFHPRTALAQRTIASIR